MDRCKINNSCIDVNPLRVENYCNIMAGLDLFPPTSNVIKAEFTEGYTLHTKLVVCFRVQVAKTGTPLNQRNMVGTLGATLWNLVAI